MIDRSSDLALHCYQYLIHQKGEFPKWHSSPVTTHWRACTNQVADGKPIVGCGAGTGISAKFAEAGGTDLIIIYNSGRYRMAGRGSLAGLMPYGDANGIVVEMAAEVLPVVKDTPVQAGVCGTDPFRLMPVFLKQLKEMGFTGVQNFPTVGLFDGDHAPKPGSHRHGL